LNPLRGVVELVVVVEVDSSAGEFVAVQFDVGHAFDLLLGDGGMQVVGAIVIPASGTKVRWRPIRPL
jgi:hypothetical protein